MWLSELTLQAVGFRLLALAIIVAVHGSVVTGMAVLLGDKGPKYDGRLTLWPGSHLDLAGGVALVFFGVGWGKPVDVEAQSLRFGRFGILLVILAGFLALLCLAALLGALIVPALTTLSHTNGLATAAFLRAAETLTIMFALFSLVPIPPLTGGLLLGALGVRLSSPVRRVLTVALLVAVATGVVREVLGPATQALAAVIP